MQTNNKLREALKLCVDEMCTRCREIAAVGGNPLPCLSGCEPVRKAKAALAKPPRNCDVGTTAEQIDRHESYCLNCRRECLSLYDEDARDKCIDCFAKWSQLPYGDG